MKLLKLALLTLVAAFCMQARAQRTPVPVVDFANIPVAQSAAKALTADQVRDAIGRAAAAQSWTVSQVGEGELEARFVKNAKHTVVVAIRYDATRYAVAYKDSIDMKFEERSLQMDTQLYRSAAQKQKEQFVTDPLTAYAVVRRDALLHPFYERWVRQLLAGIGAQLGTA
jgi:hypothetical protein